MRYLVQPDHNRSPVTTNVLWKMILSLTNNAMELTTIHYSYRLFDQSTNGFRQKRLKGVTRSFRPVSQSFHVLSFSTAISTVLFLLMIQSPLTRSQTSKNTAFDNCFDSFVINDVDNDGSLDYDEGWAFILEVADTALENASASNQESKSKRKKHQVSDAACVKKVLQSDELFGKLSCVCQAYDDKSCCISDYGSVTNNNRRTKKKQNDLRDSVIHLPGKRYGIASYATDVCLVLLRSLKEICTDKDDAFSVDLNATVHNQKDDNSSVADQTNVQKTIKIIENFGPKHEDDGSLSQSSPSEYQTENIVAEEISSTPIKNSSVPISSSDNLISKNQSVVADDADTNDVMKSITEQYEDMFHSGKNLTHVDMINQMIKLEQSKVDQSVASDDDKGMMDDDTAVVVQDYSFQRTLLPIIVGMIVSFSTVIAMMRYRLKVVRRRTDLRALRRKQRRRANRLERKHNQESSSGGGTPNTDEVSEDITLPAGNTATSKYIGVSGSSDEDDDDGSNTGIMNDMNYKDYQSRVGACSMEPDTVMDSDPRRPFLIRRTSENEQVSEIC